ncbi:MAG: histidine kinase [bacterium]
MRDDATRDAAPYVDAKIDWRIGIAFVVGLSAVFAAQGRISSTSATPFGTLFERQLVIWALWLALAPVSFDVGRLMRRRGVLRASSIAIFIASGLLISVLHAALAAIVRSILGLAPSEHLTQAVMMSIAGSLSVNFVRFWFISALYHVMAYHREVREREVNAAKLAASLAQARLESLEGRLQPHFLFNTLNAITTLIRPDPAAAEAMTGHLRDLLRAALDVDNSREVTLQREIDMLSHYLAIQRARFEERLNVMLEVEPEVLPAYMPHLILLPIVDNAIRHGIASRQTPGSVWIRGRRKGDMLQLDVQDDGVGIGRAPAAKDGHGIGISSTRTRLRQLYGDAARFHIGQGRPDGTIVTIELPFHTETRSVLSAS